MKLSTNNLIVGRIAITTNDGINIFPGMLGMAPNSGSLRKKQSL